MACQRPTCSEASAGHSLGGAIAQLCALDLLHSLPEKEAAEVACVSFAAPAIGNAALAHLVERRGWQAQFSNYLLPGMSP